MARVVLLGYNELLPSLRTRTVSPVHAALMSSGLQRIVPVHASLDQITPYQQRDIESVRAALRSRRIRTVSPTRASLVAATYKMNEPFNSMTGWNTQTWTNGQPGTASYEARIVDGNKLYHSGIWGTNSMLNAPNVITDRAGSGVLDGLGDVYVSCRFNSYVPARVWAYQIMVEFNTGSGSRQATFHFRLRNGIPYPNNGGDGVYIYDPGDVPRRLGPLGYPTTEYQWVTVFGVFNIPTNKYKRIGFTRADGTSVSYNASSYNLVTGGGAPAHTWNIHLSTAGPSHSNWDSSGNPIPGSPPWTYYDFVDGYYDDVRVYYY
jgi:hypothetical protein